MTYNLNSKLIPDVFRLHVVNSCLTSFIFYFYDTWFGTTEFHQDFDFVRRSSVRSYGQKSPASRFVPLNQGWPTQMIMQATLEIYNNPASHI